LLEIVEYLRRIFTKKLRKITENIEDSKQSTRSSGSVAGNYIEGNESLSKKDFMMRIKIYRKEAKESRLWLHLIDIFNNKELGDEVTRLRKKTEELQKIFGAILEKDK